MPRIHKRGKAIRKLTVNGFTEAEERKMLKEAEDALKYGKRYSSSKEMFADILGERL